MGKWRFLSSKIVNFQVHSENIKRLFMSRSNMILKIKVFSLQRSLKLAARFFWCYFIERRVKIFRYLGFLSFNSDVQGLIKWRVAASTWDNFVTVKLGLCYWIAKAKLCSFGCVGQHGSHLSSSTKARIAIVSVVNLRFPRAHTQAESSEKHLNNKVWPERNPVA